MRLDIKSRSNTLLLLPLILILGYIPLLVKGIQYDPGMDIVDWGFEGTVLDKYLICKLIPMYVIAIVMLVVLIYGIKKKTITAKTYGRIFLILAAYALPVLISGIATPYRSYAFRGTFEMFMTVPIVISFVIMCLYSYYVIDTPEQILHIAKFSSTGVFLIALIGTLQTFGYDILKSRIMQYITLPSILWGMYDGPEEILVSSTLFNPDYFAVYIGMILPVCIILIFFAKSRPWKAFATLTAVLLLISLIGTGTASEYIVLAGTAVAGALVIAQRKRKYLLAALAILAVLLLTTVTAIYFIPKLSDKINNTVLGTKAYRDSMKDPVIETLEDRIDFTYPDGSSISISYDAYADDPVHVTDEAGNIIPIEVYDPDDEYTYILDDKEHEMTAFTLTIDEEEYPEHYLSVSMMGRTWDFTNAEDGTYYYLTPDMWEPVRIEQPERAYIFPDALLSGRGWIWNYCLPLLSDHMLMGIGSNNFIFRFPHNYAHYADDPELDVKPHSLYLQQWIENGFPALCLLCIFFIIYLIRCIRHFKTLDPKSLSDMAAFGLFLGVVGFMLSGLINDGMLFTQPFFWIFTGIGLKLLDTKTQRT